MNFSRSIVLLIAFLLLTACSSTSLAASVEEPEMCCGHEQTVNHEVFVFEDTNGDGEYNSNEVPLADVLVIATGNIHGSPLREMWTTNTEGRVAVTFTYTHIFWIDVIPPCGYQNDSANSIDATDSIEAISLGFVPTDPQHDTAYLRFHLWEDHDTDGIQDDREPPISHAIFAITPVEPQASSFGEQEWVSGEVNTDNALVLETNDEGWAEITLGNSCGDLRIWEPGFLHTNSGIISPTDFDTVTTTPKAITELDETDSYGSDRLVFHYETGETIFKWGLVKP